MRNVVQPGRRMGVLAAAVLILATLLLGAPGTASAHGGRAHSWGRSRVAYRTSSYRPYYRTYRTSYRAYRPYRSYYRPYYRSYAYRPYGYVRYAPVYRDVYVDDSYCDDDDYVTYVRPVVRSYHHYRHHPRVAVSLSFGSPGYFYGDPYCR